MIRVMLGAVAVLFSSSALGEGIAWHTERATWQGVGCQFADAPGRPQDAWIVTAGDEMSIVYSNLGNTFRTRRNGVQESNCNLAVPIELAPNFYISRVDQKFFYGIAKQVGVEAAIIAQSNILRKKAGGPGGAHPDDGRKSLAEAKVQFPVDQEINVALQEVSIAPVRVKEDNDSFGPFMRLCRLQREREMVFQSFMRIKVNRVNPNAEISIAIDGQDLKFSSANAVSPCPAPPNPDPRPGPDHRPGPRPHPGPGPHRGGDR